MYQDLFAQARRLAKLDARKPKQASLRRAVSSAYYALFHCLTDQACRNAIGAKHGQARYRQVLARAFAHSVMRDACKSFAGGSLKESVKKGLPVSFVIPVEITILTGKFVELQDLRHLADYDLTERFVRSEVLKVLKDVEDAVQDFLASPASDEKNFFLACLWAWSGLSKR